MTKCDEHDYTRATIGERSMIIKLSLIIFFYISCCYEIIVYKIRIIKILMNKVISVSKK